ncbi:cytochrome P460 family protein [Microbulbifer sp. PSTR4-B]|jgi:cytochrome c|uniref:cytochrome P460 family protein n=1 Tax=unclassified Microbulbifer TaxID=2619833 RepID=UPI00403AE6EE
MRTICLVTLGILFSLQAIAQENLKSTFSHFVDAQGNITLPKDYRQEWTFLGSYQVKSSSGKGWDTHIVYTQPEAVKAFRKNGKFPDGAVLVKDVNSTKSEPLTTGLAYYSTDLQFTFMMVKDTEGRFPKNEAWAEGWGWALFKPGVAKSETKTWKGSGLNNCFGCHLPAKNNDWVYTQGYQQVLQN